MAAISGTRQRILYASKAVKIDDAVKDGVQSATYGFELARTDVNAFGKLGAHDRILTTTPTVTAEIQALAYKDQTLIPAHSNPDPAGATKYRQRMLSNDVGQAIDVIISLQDDKNDDADYTITNASAQMVRCKGTFISSATAEASVGAFALETVGFEGTGIDDNAGVDIAVPAWNGAASKVRVTHQKNVSVNFPTGLGGANSTSAAKANPSQDTTVANQGTAIKNTSNSNSPLRGVYDSIAQSCNMSVNITREVLEKFGRLFSDTRLIQFPMTASMTVEGLQVFNELDFENAIAFSENRLLETMTFTIDTKNYGLLGASADSITFNGGIGDNHTVSVALSSSIGGLTDATRNFKWFE